MNKDYSMTVEYSPAYELIVSLYTFIYNRKLKTIDLKEQWIKETKANIPANFINELEDERWEVLHRIVLLISQCDEKETIDGFLTWFERLSAGEIYERLAPWVDTISTELGMIRDNTVEILHKWNEYYFKNIDPAILPYLKQDAKNKREKVTSYQPIDLIEEATNGIRIEQSESLNRLILIPQFHCYPVTILDYFNGIATCLYPAWNLAEFDQTKEMIKLMQCIGDETRLRILMYVAKKPRTLIDIHKHLKLAKSTIHHHIAQLRRVGVIRSHFIGSSTPAFYSLRKKFITEFTDEFKELFES
ncbi:ArsR/SmtB family transcription factor [Heyndrickxia sp. NPDC080065]|uniref:ArsR/SmtB family transcription factor n=1 Tax=Heyndrickxia sp. NPDC080065 TaxID=3390568 RepID=UPI003D03106D